MDGTVCTVCFWLEGCLRLHAVQFGPGCPTVFSPLKVGCPMRSDYSQPVAGPSFSLESRLFYAIAVIVFLWVAFTQLPKIRISYVQEDRSYYVPEKSEPASADVPEVLQEPVRIETPIQEPSSDVVEFTAPVVRSSILPVENEAAPVWAQKLSREDVYRYIDRFAPVAIAEMRKYGIPASISLGQAIIESRAGTSKLCVKANNHFGMKCFSKKCEHGHCLNFSDDHHKDFFRKYKSAWSSWRSHSELLINGYGKLRKYGKDYRSWAMGLRKYATDKDYPEKLIGVIERYELQRFDRQ